MLWAPNKITLLRVAVGFLAVSLFGKSPWMNLLAVALTVTAIALDALDGHIARKKNMATPEGAQIDILGKALAALANERDWPIWHWHIEKQVARKPGGSIPEIHPIEERA